MPKIDQGPDLTEFVQRNRVHYTVETEAGVGPSGRVPVGFDVRLFAAHPAGEHVTPHCPICAQLATHLRSLANLLVPPGVPPVEVGIEPVEPVLYESKQSPGSDEVALEIRISHRGVHEQPIQEQEHSRLQTIRERLKTLGVPERA